MSDTSSVPEPVIESASPVAEVPPPVAAPAESPPEVIEPAEPPPPPPLWLNRKYISRSFAFEVGGKTIEGNFYEVSRGKLEVDGLYGGQEFETLIHLATLANWTAAERDEVLARIDRVLKS